MLRLLAGVGGGALILSLVVVLPGVGLIIGSLALIALSDVWSLGRKEPGTSTYKKISETTLGDVGESIGKRFQRIACRSELEACELEIKRLEQTINPKIKSPPSPRRERGFSVETRQILLQVAKERLIRLQQELKRLS